MAESSLRPLRLGTRGSKLARWQADWVANQLRLAGHRVEIVEIATRGDAERESLIGDIGTGVFTKEIQRALLVGDVDLAVHSLKDLPTEEIEGLILGAVPKRESSADVLVARAADSLDALPIAARVGTGSLRRQAQLRHVRPDLRVERIRGNVDTRLRKLDDGEFDALVLAEAGLKRLGLNHRIAQVMSHEVMLPAVGQGALAIECREDDAATRNALAALEDRDTRAAVMAERTLLSQLRGGCLAPIGALGVVQDDLLHLSAVVLSADGTRRLFAKEQAAIADAELLGRTVAERLLGQEAADLITAARD